MKVIHQPQDVISDRYKILHSLGQGGMGMTYAAEDLRSGQRVALKVLSLQHMTDWKTLELFEREARVLEAIDHPQIPAYLEHFQTDVDQGQTVLWDAMSDSPVPGSLVSGSLVPSSLVPGSGVTTAGAELREGRDRRFYLVQELAPGQSLAAWVEQGWRADEAEVQHIALQVLEILNYLHQLTPPVIHRDIKPQNLVRRPDGQICLVDFGAVQMVYRETLAMGGTFVGTFGYMPPEQFRGAATFASDLYSLGATLLYVLTHQAPADLPQHRLKIQFRDRLQLSPAFANWLDRMLEPVVEDRFATAWIALESLQNRVMPDSLAPDLTCDLAKDCAGITSGQRAGQLAGARRRKPAGSLVCIDRSPDHFAIDIPPSGATQDPVDYLVRAAVPLSVAAGCGALALGGGAAFLYGLPVLVAAGGYSLGRVLFRMAGWSHVLCDRQSLQLGWSCLGVRQQSRCNVRAITQVEVAVTVSPTSGRRRSRLVIWEGKTPHTVGQHLAEVEQEWLAAELMDFLQELRS